MSKLHFYYSVMNAGKSTHLLQAAHNYESLGWKVLCFTSAIDNRSGRTGLISSRIGIEREAIAMTASDNFDQHLTHDDKIVVFVDEVQFFTPDQIKELAHLIVDHYKIPVLCYGLKNNSNGELFGPAIIKLLALADNLRELKTVCHCGSKATQILRYVGGKAVVTGEKDVVEIGDTQFKSTCREHWFNMINLGRF